MRRDHRVGALEVVWAFAAMSGAAGCGCAEHAPPATAAPVVAPSRFETADLAGLCGHPAEAALRALGPELAPCGDVRAEIAVTHLEAGEVIVAATQVGEEPGHVVISLGGTRVPSLPESPPRTAADRGALAFAATIVAHGAPVFADHVSLRGLGPWSAAEFLDRTRLGRQHDARGERFVSVAIEVVGDARTTMSFEASVDARGHVEVARVPLARFTGSDPSQGTIVALEGAAPVARTMDADVCTSPDQAAIRVRVPELPPCADDLAARYAAASTREGQLVAVRWRGISGGARMTLGAARSGAPSPLAPSTPDDLAAIAAAIVMEMDGLSRVAFDDASAAELLTPEERPLLGRLRGDAIGVRREGSRTHLTALCVRTDVLHDGAGTELSRWIRRCDVRIDDEGAWDAESRTLSHRVGGREVQGLQPSPQPYPDEPLPSLDGL